MSSTDNLKAAFAGESQANRRYLAFAKKADEEGYPQIAKLFRAAAAAETVHAHNHLNVLDGVSDTSANLREAISGETFEFTKMYPEFIAAAVAEDAKKAKWSFHVANEVEKVHAALFTEALEKMEQAAGADFHVCGVCGNTILGEPPDTCPFCGAKKEEFMLVQ